MRENGPDGPGRLGAIGLLLLVFLAGMAYATVRQSAARGTVAGLVSGANSQGKEATIEGTIIREPDVREGRAACIVRVHNVDGSPPQALDMARALRNAHEYMGATLEEAAAMAALTPARVLGIEGERGSLAPGLRADLVLLDKDWRGWYP
ncbi:MAG: amidohydrolase family protein, partial [Actinobacteria bacterium]|nr:amidohydrolase family protein [Actinomycetota bacterium]